MSNLENLLKWAKENKERGCLRSDMRATAIKDGWDPMNVDRVINEAFDGKPTVILDKTVVPLNQSKIVPWPDLSNNKTSILAGGKKINISFTLNLPKVVVFDNFLSDGECDQLIELSKPQLTRSTGVNVVNGSSEVTEARTSSGTFFRKGSIPLVDEIDARIAEAVNWPVENGEDLQILHYENGQRYIPHHDYFHEEYEGTKNILARGGNRVATMLLYLATPEEGGPTTFPETGLSIFPQKGNALFFTYPTPTADTKTLHGGDPVTVGEKYVATKWLRWGKFK
jgi:prolyl 4-hydroxylase